MATPAPRFTEQTLKFLRALKRNNNREWFRSHKAAYEANVRAPMLAIIEWLAEDFSRIAPELVASPRSMYRIYRDTRFSPDKTPYKTQVAAAFTHERLPKQESAALYFHLAPDQFWIGGGLYAPQRSEIHRIREHICANFSSFRSLVESTAIRRMGGIQGAALQRVPRGFARDHEAGEYLKLKQYLLGVELDPTLATSPRCYSTLLRRFTAVAPFVHFLNAPLLTTRRLTLDC